MSQDQKQMQLMVRRELARRPLDCSMVQISVTHGVVYLRGTIRAMRGHDIDVVQEISILSTVLRQRAGVRDVVSELQTR
jgi:osmotically-inducible protein OsmY